MFGSVRIYLSLLLTPPFGRDPKEDPPEGECGDVSVSTFLIVGLSCCVFGDCLASRPPDARHDRPSVYKMDIRCHLGSSGYHRRNKHCKHICIRNIYIYILSLIIL